jgi:hypothetical protein
VFLFVRQVCGSGFILPWNTCFQNVFFANMCISLVLKYTVISQPGVTKSKDSTFKDSLSFDLVKMGVACDRNGRKENAYWFLIGKPEENRQF